MTNASTEAVRLSVASTDDPQRFHLVRNGRVVADIVRYEDHVDICWVDVPTADAMLAVASQRVAASGRATSAREELDSIVEAMLEWHRSHPKIEQA